MTRNINLRVVEPLDLPASTGGGLLGIVTEECSRCGLCSNSCAFLAETGAPGHIGSMIQDGSASGELAFSCSLCQLCTHHCPKNLPVSQMFLELRRDAVAANRDLLKRYSSVRSYEAVGGSRLFRGYYLPSGCNTVFYPGCALPGERPEATSQLYKRLKELFPGLGLVLDCCGKISADLGDSKILEEKRLVLSRLMQSGVQHIITACPSCLAFFQNYGDGVEVSMAYTHLRELKGGSSTTGTLSEVEFTVHDPCKARFNTDLQQSIREMVSSCGGVVTEMKHSGYDALCCGKGGATSCIDPSWKRGWQERRKGEIDGRKLVTYCAGCTHSLSGYGAVHILDLLFPGRAEVKGGFAGRIRFYLNRLVFKAKISFSHFSGRLF